MDVYKLLHQDHETVKSIFEELEETGERAVKKRESLFNELNLELTVHALAEEKFLYPRLKDEDETNALALEAVEEHKVMKTLLKELEANDKGSDSWAGQAQGAPGERGASRAGGGRRALQAGADGHRHGDGGGALPTRSRLQRRSRSSPWSFEGEMKTARLPDGPFSFRPAFQAGRAFPRLRRAECLGRTFPWRW